MSALHRRIGADIEQRIRSGEWPPGARVPTEAELQAQYGCARMTVSRALTDLSARGLILRRRRAGSVVARPPVHSAVLDIPDIAAEIEARGMAYGYERLDHGVRTTRPDEAWLGERVVTVSCLHRADGAPFALERRLIGLAATPEVEGEPFETVAPGGWLLRRAPWTDAEHRIAAVAADRETALRLDLSPGEACLRLERRTWIDGLGVTWAWQTFPGQAYDLVARFSPARPETR
ncbi:MAG: UTRA domain-containing protein [Brevundimonas sp.]|jgi:GntR family histidine utilization transcriptional repressor|uniref:UTRA domain-containing protein n=1 Tax=Brevundimonas sp. TaxID=1871086 RepID=UPI00403435A8